MNSKWLNISPNQDITKLIASNVRQHVCNLKMHFLLNIFLFSLHKLFLHTCKLSLLHTDISLTRACWDGGDPLYILYCSLGGQELAVPDDIKLCLSKSSKHTHRVLNHKIKCHEPVTSKVLLDWLSLGNITNIHNLNVYPINWLNHKYFVRMAFTILLEILLPYDD